MKEPKDIDFTDYINGLSPEQIDEPTTLSEDEEERRKNYHRLNTYKTYWEQGADFRTRRERNVKFVRGDSLSDIVEDPSTGETMREDEYIMRQGKTPIKLNLIRSAMKNLIGQYRDNDYKPIARATNRWD